MAAHTLDRPRLRERLRHDDVVLGVLVAPAGFGKTTAAMQLATSIGEVFWLNAEEADNAPARFFNRLGRAVDVDTPSIRKILDEMERGTGGVELAIEQLYAHVHDRPARSVLVIDDFHKLTNPALVHSLGRLLIMRPSQWSVLCVGRSEPDLPTAKIHSQGRLLELRRRDLAFTLAEADELFQAMHGKDAAERDHVAEIVRRTAGWPALVHMAGQASVGVEVTPHAWERSQEIDRYVRSEVLAGLPEDALRFMSDISLAEEIEPSLANAITRSADGFEFLTNLSRCGQFVSGGESSKASFRLQPLVRQVLITQLAISDPPRYREVQGRAARWYFEHGRLLLAIRAATESRDVSLGQELIARSWRDEPTDEIAMAVTRWADMVGPDGTVHGEVCLGLARQALHLGDSAAMHRWLTRAAQFASGGNAELAVAIATHGILGFWAIRVGDAAGMANQANAGISLIGTLGEQAEQHPAMQALHGALYCLAGTAALFCGNEAEATRLLGDAVQLARRAAHEPSLVTALGYLALQDALAGRLRNALEHSAEAISRFKRKETRGLVEHSMALLASSIAHLANDDESAARETLEAALSLRETDTTFPVQAGLVELQRARLLHRRGALEEARTLLGAARHSMRASTSPLLEREVSRFENELRFISAGSNEDLPVGARDLTAREIEIVALLPGNDTRAEIAGRLHISKNTLKTHLTSISRKLNASGRSAIVAEAIKLGLLAPPGES